MFSKAKAKRPRLPDVQRLPGQSLRDEWDRLVNENLPFILLVPGMLWFVWFTHWLPGAKDLSVNFWLDLAIVVSGMAAIAYLRLIPKARRLVRGERGEVCVAEILNELRAHGYRIAHDLARDGFNIDHVVVGPAGVFAIETKFRSGGGEITFRNGEGLFIDGRPEEKDSLNQAVANAAEVRRMLKEDCKVHEWVSAVLVFVGDWQIRNKWHTTNARVVTTDKVVDHIVDQQPRLTRQEIELIASHLERSAKS